jgi:hypothetical protein
MKITRRVYFLSFLALAVAVGIYYYFFNNVNWKPCTYDESGNPTCRLPSNEPQDFDEWANEGWCGKKQDNETWANLEPHTRNEYREKKKWWIERGFKGRDGCPGDYRWGSQGQYYPRNN